VTPRSTLLALARGLALFLGGFTLVNLVAALRTPAFDANTWWIGIGFVPTAAGDTLLAVAGVLLAAFAVRPAAAGWRRIATVASLVVLMFAVLDDAVGFYDARAAGDIVPRAPVPLSFVVGAALMFLLWAVMWAGMDREGDARPHSRRERVGDAVLIALVVVACGFVFPLAQILFFGTTDYRRRADAVVVLGAQVHADGTPSTALNDRVTTAIELYKQGLAGTIVMSGGTGESGYNEAEVMRDMAVARGVPASAILLDTTGVNTQATVAHTDAILDEHGLDRVMVTSHFYHLPRIKLAYAAEGRDVFTVPSTSTGPIPNTPLTVMREVPGFWVYYLRAVL
jgi:vancomycin permeability regulator SanA